MADGSYTDTLKKFEAVLEKQGKDITDIKQALLGTEFGEQGLVRRVERIEQDVDDLKRFKARIGWMIAGAGAGGGAGLFGILKVIFGL